MRLHESGRLTGLDGFFDRCPPSERESVRRECEQILRLRGVIKQHDGLTAGQRLASYEIIDCIGSGGMGAVYRARDATLGRDIAIKVLPPELACQPDRAARFEREAKAIATLDHPSIVTIYSVEEADGVRFLRDRPRPE